MGVLWIVIPTRDRPEALGRQLERVLGEADKLVKAARFNGALFDGAGKGSSPAGLQRARRVVVVVSDDGSEPPARVPRDSRVTLVRSRVARGPNVARDLAIRRSPRDAVIVEIDDHDLVEPGALAEIDRVFHPLRRSAQGAFVAFGDFLRVNARGGLAVVDPLVRKGEYRPWRFRDEGALHAGVRAYRRELYDEVGGYRADEFPAGDYALMLRMEARLRGRGIVAVPKVLCRVVTSARGISVRMAKEQAEAAAECRRRIGAEVKTGRERFKSPGEPGARGVEPEPPDFSDVTETMLPFTSPVPAGRYAGRDADGPGRTGPVCVSPRGSAGLETGLVKGNDVPVSAIVPLFRSERFVKQCLLSLSENLPPGSEIIAVDDASPDRSGDVAERVLDGLASTGLVSRPADAEAETQTVRVRPGLSTSRPADQPAGTRPVNDNLKIRGVVVRLSRNTGYAHATNVGARLARGRYLLLFNADAFAQHRGFLAPMFRLLDENPDAAVVGNRHVTPGGRVDSEGSEFSWRARTYQHVGRDLPSSTGDDLKPADAEGETQTVRVGQGLPTSRPADPQARNRRREREMDMVTFACALVRRASWEELGGLDERYRRAYFEDSDFCMRARLRGWRILYCPDPGSEILHVGRHSNAGNGDSYRGNRRLFERRWVETGLVDRFRRERGLRVDYDDPDTTLTAKTPRTPRTAPASPRGACPARPGSGRRRSWRSRRLGGEGRSRVVVCMIACSEEEFVASAIESVYQLADRLVIVEGGNRFAVQAGLCDERGRSLDRTLDEIEDFAEAHDPENKIELHVAPGRPWRDKCEMRERYVRSLRPGDWMLLLDADEVFTEEGLWRMSALMHEADVVCPAFHLFWNNLVTLGTGRWDDFRQIKAVRWREGLTYLRDHNVPTDQRGVAVTAIRGVRVARPEGRLYCHYSWAGKTDEKLRRKCAYYVAQNGAEVFPPDWFDRVFLPWRERPDKRDEIERRFGTHPYGGGATAPFKGHHPRPVARRMRDGRVRDAVEGAGAAQKGDGE